MDGSRRQRNAETLSTDHLDEKLGAKTARSGLIIIATQPLRIILQFAATAVMARLLKPADFGLVAMAGTVTGFATLFSDLGISAATYRLRKLDDETVSGLFYFNVAIGFAIAPVVWVFAPVAAWFFHDERVMPLVIALSATIPLSSLGTQHTVLLLRALRPGMLQVAGIAGHMVGALTGVVAAWMFHLGYWSLVLTAWTASLTTVVLLWVFCAWRPTLVRDWTGARAALRIGLNVTGYSVVNYFHLQLDNLLLGWRAGSIELGYYSRAYQLMLMPANVFGRAFAATLEPALARLQHDGPRWRQALLDALIVAGFLGGGLATGLAAGSRPLILLVYGNKWGPSADMFFWLAVALFAGVPMNATSWIYVSLARTDRMLTWALIFTPILAVAFVLAAPYGGVGVAMAYAIVCNATLIPNLAFAAHGTPVSLSDMLRAVMPTMVVGAVAAATGLLTPMTGLPVLSELVVREAVTGAVYLTGSGFLLLVYPPFAGVRQRLAGVMAVAASRVGLQAPRLNS